MHRRFLLVLPALVAAFALVVAPAMAGEDDGDSASATLSTSQGCVSGERAKAKVSGSQIASVAFYVDGERLKKLTAPNSGDDYLLRMKCSDLSVGAHRARAVVKFEEGSSPASRTLRFQITRSPNGTPRFAG